MKKIVLSFILIALLSPHLKAQLIKASSNTTKKRLVILPSAKEEKIHSLIVDIVATEAAKLTRYEVYNRQDLEDILKEQSLQMSGLVGNEDAIRIGQIVGANEAIKITVDESISITTEQLNVTGVLSFSIRQIDLNTSQTINSVNIGPLYGDFSQMRPQISLKLRQLFRISAEVLDVDSKEVLVSVGEGLGVVKGSIFEVVSPDEIKTFGNKEVVIPGRSIGFIKIGRTSKETSRSKIIRRWGKEVKAGYSLVEQPTMGNSIHYGIIASKNDYSIPFTFFLKPFNNVEIKGGLSAGMLVDSRQETNFTFGAPLIFSTYKLIQSSKFTLGGILNLHPDFILDKKDDEGNNLVGFRTKAAFGLETNILTSASRDLVFAVEFVLGSNISWSVSSSGNENNKKPIWDKEIGPPGFEPNRLQFRFGIRNLNLDIIDMIGN